MIPEYHATRWLTTISNYEWKHGGVANNLYEGTEASFKQAVNDAAAQANPTAVEMIAMYVQMHVNMVARRLRS